MRSRREPWTNSIGCRLAPLEERAPTHSRALANEWACGMVRHRIMIEPDAGGTPMKRQKTYFISDFISLFTALAAWPFNSITITSMPLSPRFSGK